MTNIFNIFNKSSLILLIIVVGLGLGFAFATQNALAAAYVKVESNIHNTKEDGEPIFLSNSVQYKVVINDESITYDGISLINANTTETPAGQSLPGPAIRATLEGDNTRGMMSYSIQKESSYYSYKPKTWHTYRQNICFITLGAQTKMIDGKLHLEHYQYVYNIGMGPNNICSLQCHNCGTTEITDTVGSTLENEKTFQFTIVVN